MKSHIVPILAIAMLALGCQTKLESPPIRYEGEETKGVVVSGLPVPSIFHIVNTTRDEILAAADIVFFWDGSSKFGSTYFKHNGKWYASGGFIGNVSEFIENEARISTGTVVYVTDSRKPFNNTKYGAMISTTIARGSNEKWKFYYIEASIFGEPPAYRQYYDEQNKKIEYKDY